MLRAKLKLILIPIFVFLSAFAICGCDRSSPEGVVMSFGLVASQVKKGGEGAHGQLLEHLVEPARTRYAGVLGLLKLKRLSDRVGGSRSPLKVWFRTQELGGECLKQRLPEGAAFPEEKEAFDERYYDVYLYRGEEEAAFLRVLVYCQERMVIEEQFVDWPRECWIAELAEDVSSCK